MIDNYTKAYKEVIEILKYVPKESVDKIPEKTINMYKVKMDENWDFKVDINKPFEEQDLLEETKAIFANIFRDYWATSEQRERIEAREKYELEKIEEEKREKYNPNEVFKNDKFHEVDKNVENNEKNLPIEVKRDKFFERLLNFLKKFFFKK